MKDDHAPSGFLSLGNEAAVMEAFEFLNRGTFNIARYRKCSGASGCLGCSSKCLASS